MIAITVKCNGNGEAELNFVRYNTTQHTVSEQSESSRSTQCIHDDLIIPLKSVQTDLNRKVPPLVVLTVLVTREGSSILNIEETPGTILIRTQ